jgi:group I intron endonuclease
MNDIINGVYCLTFPNGKRYVGISFGKYGIQSRWNSYKNLNCKNQRIVHNALKKYGPKNVKFEIVIKTDDKQRMFKIEQQLIALWNLTNSKYGYNIAKGGQSSEGWICTPEISKRMSDAHKGLKHSKETRNKIGKAHKGKIVSQITRNKMRNKIVSEETRNKLRLAQLGRKLDINTRNKMKESQKRRFQNNGVSEETRRKLRENALLRNKNRKCQQ